MSLPFNVNRKYADPSFRPPDRDILVLDRDILVLDRDILVLDRDILAPILSLTIRRVVTLAYYFIV